MNSISVLFHRRNRHRFIATLFSVIVCPVLFFLQSIIQIPEFSSSVQPKVFSAPFFKFVTIGYWPAAVDWMWIQSLQIVGGKNFSAEIRPVAVNFYEIATDLDPHFYELYEQAGVFFSFLFKSPDESIYFLKKGIRNISKDWKRPYALCLLIAYVYSYEKMDWNKAKEYYLLAADMPGSPSYLQDMRLWLSEDGSEKKLGKRVLTLLIQNTTDELLKAEYQERLKSI